MNRTYGVELPEYQNTENPKYQMSKVPNTLMRPYIFVSRFWTGYEWIHITWIWITPGYTEAIDTI